MDARVVVSEETIKKAGKMSNKHKGDLRLAKLKQIAQDGTLQKAKIRFDVATLCGYTTKQRGAGYAWVKNLIKRGVLIERAVGLRPNGRNEYEYYLGTPETQTITVEDTAPQFEVVENPVENPMIMTLYHGETTLTIEGVGGDTAIEIVKSIIK